MRNFTNPTITCAFLVGWLTATAGQVGCTRPPTTGATGMTAIEEVGELPDDAALEVASQLTATDASASAGDPLSIASIGETINSDAWKLPRPLCLTGVDQVGLLENAYNSSTAHWLAAGKYKLVALDQYVVAPTVPDEGPWPVVIGHWALTDAWTANAPQTFLMQWPGCSVKACSLKLAVGDERAAVLTHYHWQQFPGVTLPLTGPSETSGLSGLFRQLPNGSWSNGEIGAPPGPVLSYTKLKNSVQTALAELASSGDCNVELLPPGFVKPVKDLPDTTSSPDDGSGWGLPDLPKSNPWADSGNPPGGSKP